MDDSRTVGIESGFYLARSFQPLLPFPPFPPFLNERHRGVPEIAAKDRDRVAAEPVVDDLRIDRTEVGFEVHVGAAVFERWIAGIGIERGGRSVQSAVDAAAKREHQRAGAVIGAVAAVL